MERLYPSALLACIGEGRSPTPHELSVLADKIWSEALTHRDYEPEWAMAAARAAFFGQQSAPHAF